MFKQEFQRVVLEGQYPKKWCYVAKKKKIQAPSVSASDPKQIFNLARNFEWAAEALEHDASVRIANEAQKSHRGHWLQGLWPMCVNRAFCVELYLKCLLLLDSAIEVRKHDYRALFDQLSSKTRNRLSVLHRQAFKETYGCDADAISSKLGMEVLVDIPDVLEKSKDAFELFRYIYEHPRPSNAKILCAGGRIDFDDFSLPTRIEIVAVKKAILEFRPDWKGE
jgi:hypothetical protein